MTPHASPPMGPFLGLDLPDHGDGRLNRRQVTSQLAFAASAGVEMTIPDALGSDARAEGFYRFVRNKEVLPEAIIAPHVKAVLAHSMHGATVVIHDTTNIQLPSLNGAQDIDDLGNGQSGFRAHTAIIVDELGATPIGLAHLEIVDRVAKSPDKKRSRKDSEGLRWGRGVQAVANVTTERAEVIHVCDREADDYSLMAGVQALGQKFIIRANQDRMTATVGQTKERIFSLIGKAPLIGHCTVDVPPSQTVNRRRKDTKRTDRTARTATLQLRAIPVRLLRPKNQPGKGQPRYLDLWVIDAREECPPDGEADLHWTLWSNLPTTTVAEALRALALYRARWRTEELYKALKTGLAFGKTRFESKFTACRALALMLPVAAGLLRLRAMENLAPTLAGEHILDPIQIRVLHALDPKLPAKPTIGDVLRSIARLGGFLIQNKKAGWLVLGRGYSKFLLASAAWKFSRNLALSPLEASLVAM